MRPCPPPIFHDLRAALLQPFLHKPHGGAREKASDDFPALDGDFGDITAIMRMEMRRGMVIEKHLNGYAVEV